MKKYRRSSFILCLGWLALSGCRKDLLGPTGVQVDLFTETSNLFATSFAVTWLDERNRLIEVRVPEEGYLDEDQARAVSVFIALDAANVGRRRIVARGLRDDVTLVSWATARIDTAPNVWLQLGMKMLPASSLMDRDGDGLPDTIDNCPWQPDPCTGAPEPDAGPPDGGEADAGADADAGPDAAAPPDVWTDLTITPSAFDAAADKGKPADTMAPRN